MIVGRTSWTVFLAGVVAAAPSPESLNSDITIRIHNDLQGSLDLTESCEGTAKNHIKDGIVLWPTRASFSWRLDLWKTPVHPAKLWENSYGRRSWGPPAFSQT